MKVEMEVGIMQSWLVDKSPYTAEWGGKNYKKRIEFEYDPDKDYELEIRNVLGYMKSKIPEQPTNQGVKVLPGSVQESMMVSISVYQPHENISIYSEAEICLLPIYLDFWYRVGKLKREIRGQQVKSESVYRGKYKVQKIPTPVVHL